MTAKEAYEESKKVIDEKYRFTVMMAPYFKRIKDATSQGEYGCEYHRHESIDNDMLIRKELIRLGYKIESITSYGSGAYGENEYQEYIVWR